MDTEVGHSVEDVATADAEAVGEDAAHSRKQPALGLVRKSFLPSRWDKQAGGYHLSPTQSNNTTTGIIVFPVGLMWRTAIPP